jgi:hypothetical protein
MQKVLQWSVPNNTEIKNENVGSVLIHVAPIVTGGEIADISNINNIEFGITLKRGNSEEKTIFDGYLGDFLQFLYGGTTRLETVLEKTSIGYLFNLEFAQRFNVRANDTLTIKTNFGKPSDSFTSGVLTGSTVVIYTNPSSKPNPQNYTAVYKSFPIPVGEVDFEKHLGSNVSKVMFHAHPTSTFDAVKTANTDALPLTMELVSDTYSEDKTQVELLSSAQMGISYNPDSDVKNLVQYNDSNILTNVRLKTKLSKAATTNTKILVTTYKML